MWGSLKLAPITYIPWSVTPPELLTSIPRNIGYTHFYYSMHLGLYPVVGKVRNAIVTVSLLPLSSSIRVYSSSKVSMESVFSLYGLTDL